MGCPSTGGDIGTPRVGRTDGWPPVGNDHRIPLTGRLTIATIIYQGFELGGEPLRGLSSAIGPGHQCSRATGDRSIPSPLGSLSRSLTTIGRMVDGVQPNLIEGRVRLATRIRESLKQSPAGLPQAHVRFYTLGRIAFSAGLVAHGGFVVMFWLLDLRPLAAFNLLSVALFALGYWQHKKGHLTWPLFIIALFEVPVHAILATMYVGAFSAFWAHNIISMSIIVLDPLITRRSRYVLCSALTLVMIAIGVYAKLTDPLRTISTGTEIFFFANNIIVMLVIVVAVIATYDLAVTRAEEALQFEFSRAEALLLNILPAEIATRLKANEEPLADTHESVSVLFADLAGFTGISRTMSADELVNLLNDLFSRFDKLSELHGAEKIKTIGDAYMVATGLNGNIADHAENIADLALDMRQAFGEFRRDNNVDLKLRIGVHSGTVIAGVIGKQKFSYDLWGNTVNVASRMESEGIADHIQISEETWKMLSDRYQTSPRGEIQIKGHRPRATYLLEGKAPTTESTSTH